MRPPDPAPTLDLIEAFRHPKTMFTAVAMGILDRLNAGSATATALAAPFGADADALERLLDGCAALGLLEKRDGVYSNSLVASTRLCSSIPDSVDATGTGR